MKVAGLLVCFLGFLFMFDCCALVAVVVSVRVDVCVSVVRALFHLLVCVVCCWLLFVFGFFCWCFVGRGGLLLFLLVVVVCCFCWFITVDDCCRLS